MSDHEQLEEPAADDIVTEEGSDSQSSTNFEDASKFVDDEIDKVEDIGELSIEALVVLSVLRIVHNPDVLRVNIIRASRLVVIELDVKAEDLGQLIGKEGHTIDSVRDVARAAAGNSGVEYDIYPLEKGKRPVRGVRRRFSTSRQG